MPLGSNSQLQDFKRKSYSEDCETALSRFRNFTCSARNISPDCDYPQVSYHGTRKRLTKNIYEGAPKYEANRNRSLNTPAAVTSAPAPGPLTIRGWLAYLVVVKAIILSVPESCAKAWDFGNLCNSTLPSLFNTSTTPT